MRTRRGTRKLCSPSHRRNNCRMPQLVCACFKTRDLPNHLVPWVEENPEGKPPSHDWEFSHNRLCQKPPNRFRHRQHYPQSPNTHRHRQHSSAANTTYRNCEPRLPPRALSQSDPPVHRTQTSPCSATHGGQPPNLSCDINTHPHRRAHVHDWSSRQPHSRKQIRS